MKGVGGGDWLAVVSWRAGCEMDGMEEVKRVAVAGGEADSNH